MKILVPISGLEVAPRFDMAPEVLIATTDENKVIVSTRTMVLPQASADDLCSLILTEHIDIVACNGIEEEYYRFLTWKKITIIDAIMDTAENALALACSENTQHNS
ncbi:MAG: NifB/NifX family molybdenum-iron cluster-binding protein [Desulfoplanes sp.]|nr:NifB/NifX family molybdenum-iron cluster-binding protein [Desulfoplanes sp.]MDD4649071.1 NifB/NifX family molybdenum-iron cluster-binding protein [Desulfoplanes sp.]